MKNTNFWNDERVLQFCKLSTLGSYGDFEGCYTLESKLKAYKKNIFSLKENLLQGECIELTNDKNDIIYVWQNEITKIIFITVNKKPVIATRNYNAVKNKLEQLKVINEKL